MTLNEIHKLLSIALAAGIRASEAIMEVYDTPFGYDDKADGSPITLADRRSNQIITEVLEDTGIRVISEENHLPEWSERRSLEYFWLVDPLDGTKEFIGRNGEFAINIALMHQQPLAGIIIWPVAGKAWWGVAFDRAFRIDSLSFAGNPCAGQLLNASRPIEKRPRQNTIGLAVSRSHLEPQTLGLIKQIKEKFGAVALIEKGSALKFCDLLEGSSDVYARYSPTWEWDTAAGHALLRASGGELFHIKTHKPLIYNKPELINPGCIAFACEADSVRYFSELSF